MATEVNLPALGESVTEGTVTRWLKQVGDSVAVDEPLLEVSTDKVDTEIPSPVAGTLLEIKAAEDDTVEVGAVLALIGDEGEASGDSGSADSADSGEGAESPEPGADTGGGGEDLAQERAEQQAEEADQTGTPEPAEEEPAQEPAAESSGSAGGSSGTSVTLPALGESVTDVPLLEVSTDKVDTEIPSPVAGTLLEIKVEEDETVEVGAELAIVGDKGAAPSTSTETATPEAQPKDAEQAEKKAEQEEEIVDKTGDLPAGDETPEKAKEPEPATEPAKAPEKAPATEPEPAPAPAAAKESGGPSGSPAETPPTDSAETAADTTSDTSSDGASYVTPLVRKLAAQHNVDLSSVTGSGVGGRIRKQDVLDAAKAQEQKPAPAAAPAAAAPAASTGSAPASVTPSPLRGTTEKISRLRKIIAQRVVESLQVSAQLTQVVEVDVTNIARLRDRTKADFLAREGVKLSYLPFFAKASVDALKQHPKFNATIDTDEGTVTYYDRENLAFAVDTEKGLISPVVKDAGDLSIAGLAKKIADVAERTRTNKIGPDELGGGTFTITNLGSVGALWDTPIINQPQVAILGPGAVVKRPVVIDDPNLGETIAVRHMVYLALTYDHRLIDGADAGRFLQDIKKRLEAGQFEI
jgi:pyruvate dehydrogenase E2 component (dihydrolipoamide acetyltransferase)